jgi:hypothetical protein
MQRNAAQRWKSSFMASYRRAQRNEDAKRQIRGAILSRRARVFHRHPGREERNCVDTGGVRAYCRCTLAGAPGASPIFEVTH